MNLFDKVSDAIKRDQLLPDGGAIVAGVSGGADSVALLHILHRLGYAVTAAHLNHAIRGAAADADEEFVKALCAKLGVPCVSATVDVPALAKANGISLEMAARQARHDFFRSVISDLRSPTSDLCLAHHADDQLETFFLRAARGTGPTGLGGMRSSQILGNLTLVRPMLGIRRMELIRWLEQNQLDWREDVSNADECIPRNFIRHQLLPNLGRLNPCAAENILRTMAVLRDEVDHPQKAARRREVRDWLIRQGVTPDFDSVERVIAFSAETEGSSALDLAGLQLVNEYGVVRPAFSSAAPVGSIRMEEGIGILRGRWCASISLAKVAGRAVTVRPAQPGDRMKPYGLAGSKKLQDIFTDLKIPKAQRADWPVVECGGEIVWLPGYRIARGWELTTEDEPALHLSTQAEPLEG